MNPFLTIVLIIIIAILATTLLLLLVKLVDILLSLRAPQIGVDPTVIADIAKLLQVRAGNTVYDLGSGDGRVLIDLAQSNPEASYVGYDIGFLPTLKAKFNVKRSGLGRQIKIKQANFLRQDLSDADRIFTYLFPGLMAELKTKLENEVKPGTLLVSCDYPLGDKKPQKTVRLKPDQTKRCHTLYLYQF